VRPSRFSCLRWLSLLFLTGVGCGQIEFPATLALVGENTITMEVPFFPPGQNVFGTSVVGGAESRIQVDLTDPLQMFQPEGLAANVLVDRVLIAGGDINIFGLHTGTVCTSDDPDNPGSGIAFLRPIQQEGEFHITMNTLISVTNPQLAGFLPGPLPFAADLNDTTRVTLLDMLNLALGKPADIEISQVIQAVLPDDIPLLAGSIITADVTLKTVDQFPSDPLLTECDEFLAGQ
jgi:hypothetical protein